MLSTSSLSNGIRVVSVSNESFRNGGDMSAISIHVETCSPTSSVDTQQQQHSASWKLFSKLAECRHSESQKEIDQKGSFTFNKDRECISVIGQSIGSDSVPKALNSIAKALIPEIPFKDSEIRKQVELVQAEDEQMLSDPDSAMDNLIHGAAFGKESNLGNSQTISNDWKAKLESKYFRDFSQQFLLNHPERIVVSGVNVDHKILEQSVERSSLGKLRAKVEEQKESTAQTTVESTPLYKGGKIFTSLEGMNPTLKGHRASFTHLGLFFAGAALRDCEKTILSGMVMRMLLGGGQSFSVGGPGKGLHSRLFRSILTNPWVDSAVARSISYRNTGLFGISGAVTESDPEKVVGFLRAITEQLLFATAYITDYELERSVNGVKSLILRTLETSVAKCDDLGKQLLFRKKWTSPQELCDEVGKLTKRDLMTFMATSLSTHPTLVGLVPEALLQTTAK